MIILVEINVKTFLRKCVKKASIYGKKNNRVEPLSSSKRYCILLTEENLSGVISLCV